MNLILDIVLVFVLILLLESLDDIVDVLTLSNKLLLSVGF